MHSVPQTWQNGASALFPPACRPPPPPPKKTKIKLTFQSLGVNSGIKLFWKMRETYFIQTFLNNLRSKVDIWTHEIRLILIQVFLIYSRYFCTETAKGLKVRVVLMQFLEFAKLTRGTMYCEQAHKWYPLLRKYNNTSTFISLL